MHQLINHNILAVILAGGKGSRLEPLTRDRAKPAVPFAGAYRIIDFTLSNCLNSGIRRTLLLTQYKSMSLDQHILAGWQRFHNRELGEFLDILPPQQRITENWYQGTADAVYQNIYAIERLHPQYVLILAGDHIYKMNYLRMIHTHLEKKALLTIGTLRVPVTSAAGNFGVLQTNMDNRICAFQEKPMNPAEIPGDPGFCYASMGIYVFSAEFLYEQLCRDATSLSSRHDFGGNIIPNILKDYPIYAHPFHDENGKEQPYWRDVGTLDAYYTASMDLISVEPELNLYDKSWPVWTYHPNCPPPKFVFHEPDRCGHALESMICPGCVISGAEVRRSILGYRVRVNSYAHVENSILFSDVEIGRGARIRNAILDTAVKIPPGKEIGYDTEKDRACGYHISPEGTVVVKNS